VSAAHTGAEAIEHTIELLDRLFALVRLVALHGDTHEQVLAGAQSLQATIADARPPFALQLLPEAVLRDGMPLPLELEMYRRSQQLVGAVARWKMTEIAFEAVPSTDGLTVLAGAVLDATHSNRTARVPDIEHVTLRALRRPGLVGATAGEAALEVFATRQVDRALRAVERLSSSRGAAWPWAAGRAIVWRLERCMIASTGATARRIEIAPAPWTPARRALATAFYVSAVLGRLQADLLGQRAASHAALAVGCIGLTEQPGIGFAEAAKMLLPSLMPQVGEVIDTDPHRLRTTALLATAAQGEHALSELPLLSLVHAAYELERQRCPSNAGVQLARTDLHAWLAGALGRELHAGWGRALLDVLGPIPPGSHVLAEGRLGVVLGAAAKTDPMRPRVLVGGRPTAPAEAVTLHSPLAMTPWAK
jgi:hypothetical protein